MSPHEYQMGLRMELARRMLSGGGETVTEIAFSCGFEDSNYFSRYFRKHHGESPLGWRKRHGS